MIAVIFAGGLGSRLWPLSTPARPKQFLSLTGGSHPLLAQTYDRIRPLASRVLVVVPRPQVELARQSLPGLPPDDLVVEPDRRGVGLAVFLSLRQLERAGQADQPVVFLWSDHWIGDDDRFHQSLQLAAEAIGAGLPLVRFGVKPTFAATNFGYLKLGPAHPGLDQIYQLEAFREKPDQAVAEKFLADGGYLWHMGYFMTTPASLRRSLAEADPELSRVLQRLIDCPDPELDSLYRQLDKFPFEQRVSEKLADSYVIACDFPWADLGSFRDLLTVLPADEAGNFVRGPVQQRGLSGSYVNNQTDVPLAVVGLEGLAVVVTRDGILVADPKRVVDIGQLAKLIRGEDPLAD